MPPDSVFQHTGLRLLCAVIACVRAPVLPRRGRVGGKTRIRVESIQGAVLLLSAEDDTMRPSHKASRGTTCFWWKAAGIECLPTPAVTCRTTWPPPATRWHRRLPFSTGGNKAKAVRKNLIIYAKPNMTPHFNQRRKYGAIKYSTIFRHRPAVGENASRSANSVPKKMSIIQSNNNMVAPNTATKRRR